MAHCVTKPQREGAIQKLQTLIEGGTLDSQMGEDATQLISYLEEDAIYYKFEDEDYFLLRKVGMDPTTTFEVW